MKKLIVIAISAVVMLTACSQEGSKKDANPFFEPSQLFMQAPDFDKIKDVHFRPAFAEGFKQQLAEIDSIVSNTEAATFDNTIVALEKSGSILRRVSNVFFALAGAEATDSIRAIETDMTPLMAAHSDAIYLNDKLFARIKTVYENELDGLQGEDKRLLEHYYDSFVRLGANLSPEDKNKLMTLNKEEAMLANKFDREATDATNKTFVYVASKDSLAGLSEVEIEQSAKDAEAAGKKGMYQIAITNTTQQPVMASLDNRDLRKKIFETSVHRADQGAYDTRSTVTRLAEIRAEKAKLMGFPNYSAWKLQDQMAKTPEAVISFLKQLIPGYAKRAAADAADLQAFAQKTEGAEFKLEAWDWAYYAAKLRKEKFDIDESELSQYFVLDSVLEKGVFYSANVLFGLTIKQRTDLPVYHEDVKVYDVLDKDDNLIALFYTDFYRRPTKSGGAWMSNFVEQSTLDGTIPVIYNVCNYQKPANADEACLLTWDEVTTLYHEFGHALHGIFAQQKYRTLSGTSVSRDFVELPSQFNEHWASEPSVLANYAKHYKTGEPMAEELMAKFKASADFNPAYSIGENIAAVTLDMAWHMQSADKQENFDYQAFEANALKTMGVLNAQIPPRYNSTYFRHVFSGGYSSGYYSYLWAEMIEANVYEWFLAHGGMTAENGQRYLDLILSRGNSEDPAKLFTDFTGLETPKVEPLLKTRSVL